MNRKFRKAATSLLLILVVAFGARLTFAWDQARKIRAVSRNGKWIQQSVWKRDRADGMADTGLSPDRRWNIQAFRDLHRAFLLIPGFSQYSFLNGCVHSYLLRWQQGLWHRRRQRSRLA